MATSNALSTALTALLDDLAPALDGKPAPGVMQIYPRLIRARDEAVCLEARASARDVSVHKLLEAVTATCAEAARFEALITAAGQKRIVQ